MTTTTALLGLALAATACNRAGESQPPVAAAAPSAATKPGEPRRVEVKVSNQGYTPSRVTGRPGERLVLAFRYVASAGECGREVLLPGPAGQTRLRLEEGKLIEATVQLPADKSELTFTCGMNMMQGTLVAE